MNSSSERLSRHPPTLHFFSIWTRVKDPVEDPVEDCGGPHRGGARLLRHETRDAVLIFEHLLGLPVVGAPNIAQRFRLAGANQGGQHRSCESTLFHGCTRNVLTAETAREIAAAACSLRLPPYSHPPRGRPPSV